MSLQSKVLQYLNSKPDAWAIKVNSANERGCPDILCCCHGKFYAFEIKEGKDKTSPIQAAQIELIKQAGGKAIVVRDIEQVKGE